MNLSNVILSTILFAGSAGISHAEENTNPAPMPPMYNPGMNMPQGQTPMIGDYQRPMHPMQMRQMMRMRQQNMRQMMNPPEETATSTAAPQDMPMGQVMDSATEDSTVAMKRYCAMKHRMGGKRKRERMQMMQQKQAMMQEHMIKMEKHLANIEALLRQMVENR